MAEKRQTNDILEDILKLLQNSYDRDEYWRNKMQVEHEKQEGVLKEAAKVHEDHMKNMIGSGKLNELMDMARKMGASFLEDKNDFKPTVIPRREYKPSEEDEKEMKKYMEMKFNNSNNNKNNKDEEE